MIKETTQLEYNKLAGEGRAASGCYTSPARPVLRYHGGKWEQAAWIISHFAPHRIYVEPFGGAASVLLQKARAYKEIYNDLNGEAVNLFRILRDKQSAELLTENIILTPFSRDEYMLSFAATTDAMEEARRLVVRSHMSFSNRSTTNRKETGFKTRARSLNSSAGDEWYTLPEQIARITARLRGVIIENKDALALMQQHDTPETLFYLDPPYPEQSRNYFGTYRFEFTDDHHRRLKETADDLKGMCLISGYQCALYDELFGHWQRVDKAVTCDSRNGNRRRIEGLWLNDAARSRLNDSSLQPSIFGEEV